MKAGYDLIGDIHGCAHTLAHLLETLDYRQENGVYSHKVRKVIFLGDLVDRGPYQAETINLVRRMVEADQAMMVLGNHELNAIAYYTYDETSKDYLRARNDRHQRQHQAFLDEYAQDAEAWGETIEWFRTCPLWLECDGLRAIHACWDLTAMQAIRHYPEQGRFLTDALLKDCSTKGTAAFNAIETLLKGKEIRLPDGYHYHDKDGHKRHNMRVRWWDQTANNYHRAYIGPEEARTNIPDDDIEGDHLVEYSHQEPPVFLGHYWLTGEPKPLASNIACLDYSVAKPGGHLAAYRWQGEKVLTKDHYVLVARLEGAA